MACEGSTAVRRNVNACVSGFITGASFSLKASQNSSASGCTVLGAKALLDKVAWAMASSVRGTVMGWNRPLNMTPDLEIAR